MGEEPGGGDLIGRRAFRLKSLKSLGLAPIVLCIGTGPGVIGCGVVGGLGGGILGDEIGSRAGAGAADAALNTIEWLGSQE